MFGVRVVVQPTGGLTFRRLPSSILHITTYPFLPPTTMSGFLRRLVIMQNASPTFDVATLVKQQEEDRDVYALPREMVVVGAYPERGQWWIHTTKRQGIRDFKHDAFSRIYRKAVKKQVYQLHDWDYLMCERLTGHVLSENQAWLSELASLTNRGCKLGKEGFAFVAEASEPREFRLEHTKAMPTTIMPGSLLVSVPCDAFPLYRYAWSSGDDGDLTAPTPSPITGFVPFMAGVPAIPFEADYYTDGAAFIPEALVDELRKEGP